MSYNSSLTTITQGIPRLSVGLSSEAIAKMLNTPLDLDDHIKSPSENFRMEKVMWNCIHDFVSESKLQKAGQEVLDGLPLTTLDETGRVSQEHARIRPISRRYHSATEYMFGTVHTRSSESLFQSRVLEDQTEKDQYEYESSYIIHPARWLINLGFTYGFRIELGQSSVRGWKSNLSTFRPVPDDALIFEFCKKGNLPAVRSLLSKGYASVTDSDTMGRTALHVSRTSHDAVVLRTSICNGWND